MKIKAKNPKIHSVNLILPVDGLKTIDSNGVVDVSGKCAVALVNGTNDWEYLSKAKDVESEEEETEDELDERAELEAKLKGMKLEEMKDMAKEGGLDEEEWGKISTKKLMISYILQKFDEASAEEDEEEDEEE